MWFDSSLRNLKIWGTESLCWLLKKPKFGKREKAKLLSFLLCFQSPIIVSIFPNFIVVKSQSPLSVPSAEWFPVPFYTIYYSPSWKLLSWAFGMSHPCSFILCLCLLYSLLMESSFIFLFFVGTLWFLALCFFAFVLGRSQFDRLQVCFADITHSLKKYCINWQYLKIRIFNMQFRIGLFLT